MPPAAPPLPGRRPPAPLDAALGRLDQDPALAREAEIWNVSPEPRPIRFFMLTLALTEVCRPLDQVIAACGSANVDSPLTSSITGGPSEMSAT